MPLPVEAWSSTGSVILSIVALLCLPVGGGQLCPAGPPSFPGASGWPGGFAVPWNPICELSPPPTSHLQSPLLPRTGDTTGQIGVGTCLASHLSHQESRESSSQQPVTFPQASLPRGQPGGHLCPVSLLMARKSCWPGLVELLECDHFPQDSHCPSSILVLPTLPCP